MEQRVSLITLGVADLARATAFYRALGWTPHARSVAGEIVFFQAGAIVVALWSRTSLATDSGVSDDGGGWGGITLAHNVADQAEVDGILDAARDAGGVVTREAARTDWGGYSGVFHDLDGHAWEVALNPDWPLGPDGGVRLG